MENSVTGFEEIEQLALFVFAQVPFGDLVAGQAL
jgi:hypothetical protein